MILTNQYSKDFHYDDFHYQTKLVISKLTLTSQRSNLFGHLHHLHNQDLDLAKHISLRS